MKLTNEIKEQIIQLRKTHSTAEIAKMFGCTSRAIEYVLKENGLFQNSSDSAAIRSRVRRQNVRDDRRRALFGLDQKTNLKVFSNKDRIILRYCLKRKGYIFMGRGANTAYYNTDTIRDNAYEEKGIKLGLRFQAMAM